MATDRDLLERLARGDESAFAELVRAYHPSLVRLAGTFVGRRDLAEDVAQETWVAALRGLDRFEGRSSLRTWLFQICANRARSIGSREDRVVPLDPVALAERSDAFAADGSWAEPPQPWPALDEAELVTAIRRAIEELPPSQRQVVTLRDVEGLAATDVCDVLGLTEANQRVLLHRGRFRVRQILAEAVSAR
jgi:RNA polymerase sigma-70 factor (ECF subfamily)